eukprot:g6760.t1
MARSGDRWIGSGGSVRAGTSWDTDDQPAYHPEAEFSQREGFYGTLSSSQEAALGGLRQWLTREAVDLTPLLGGGETCLPEEEDLALLRFLRHNAWDVELTRAQIEASLLWRVETGVAADKHREPWDVSGCASEDRFEQLCRTYYPHYTLGTDRLGRPVLVQKYGNFDTSKLQECTTLNGLLRYHAWEQEKNAELLRRATARTGYLVETYAVIMDFKGMSMGQVNRDFLRLLRELSEIDRNHYPGRGGVIYVINTPPLFGLVWQGIQGFLATQARVHFFGNEREWKQALAKAMDPCILPLEYGGTAPPLADTPFLPAVHRALGRDATTKLAVEAAGEDASGVSMGKENAMGRSMSCLLRRFSLGSVDGSCVFEGDTGSFTSSVSGDYGGGGGSGGGSPVVVSRGLRGSSGGFKSGGLASGGGDGLSSASTNAKENGGWGWWRGGGDIASKDPPTKPSVRSGTNGVKAIPTKNGAPPSGGCAKNDKANPKPAPLRSVAPRAPPLEAAPIVIALPTSDDPLAAAPPPPPPPRSSHVVIVRQQLNGTEAGNDDGEEEDDGGDLEWVLGIVPGARLAAAVAGTVAGATLGAALGAVGFAAGVVEAVVPDQVWAEGVQAFQSAQFVGGWVLGR